jgi:hypothetical protein
LSAERGEAPHLPIEAQQPGSLSRGKPTNGLVLEQLAVPERRPYPAPVLRLGFIELPECLAFFAPSTHSEGVVRLVGVPSQLRDGSTQDFQLGALFVAQLDTPIPSLIGLSHGRCFALRRRLLLDGRPSAGQGGRKRDG